MDVCIESEELWFLCVTLCDGSTDLQRCSALASFAKLHMIEFQMKLDSAGKNDGSKEPLDNPFTPYESKKKKQNTRDQ